MSGGSSPVPRWDLSPIYPSFDSPAYREDRERLQNQIARLLERLADPVLPDTAEGLRALIGIYDEAGNIAENLSAYAEAVYTADTRDSRALGEINALEAETLPLKKAAVLFRGKLAGEKARVLRLLESETLGPYRFFITESLEKAACQMPPEQEDLANDLGRSGGDAWGR
ncbi:MAG: peptidase M3, partial [Spirochaetaceae bacterium]|nr:peptidase M3 [Spirochaetaceae bacterium]